MNSVFLDCFSLQSLNMFVIFELVLLFPPFQVETSSKALISCIIMFACTWSLIKKKTSTQVNPKYLNEHDELLLRWSWSTRSELPKFHVVCHCVRFNDESPSSPPFWQMTCFVYTCQTVSQQWSLKLWITIIKTYIVNGEDVQASSCLDPQQMCRVGHAATHCLLGSVANSAVRAERTYEPVTGWEHVVYRM